MPLPRRVLISRFADGKRQDIRWKQGHAFASRLQGIGVSWRKTKSAFVATQTTSRNAAEVTASIMSDQLDDCQPVGARGVFLPRRRAYSASPQTVNRRGSSRLLC